MIKNKPVDNIRKELKNNTPSVAGDLSIILLATSLKVLKSAARLRSNDDLLVEKLLKSNELEKHIINQTTQKRTEDSKMDIINDNIKQNRENDKWFYLASSHTDCAKDHKPYQGKLYYDEKAPNVVHKYARRKNLKTIQWVMGKPAWFVTRPNCRHYFVGLTMKEVSGHSLKELININKTHTSAGNWDLQTPKVRILEEYEDRLKLLKAMYREHKSDLLRKKIEKTEILIRKWKNAI